MPAPDRQQRPKFQYGHTAPFERIHDNVRNVDVEAQTNIVDLRSIASGVSVSHSLAMKDCRKSFCLLSSQMSREVEGRQLRSYTVHINSI